MKALDKIYLAESDNIMGEVTSNFASSTPFRRHSSIAYIRKDALLEWAKETYLNENASAIRKVCYKQLIEKIESL